MNTPIEELELYRNRWRRARSAMRLVDTSDEEFGVAGLGSFVQNPNVRILVLPSDPEATLIDFDQEFWDWWKAERDGPPFARRIRWNSVQPTPFAATRYNEYGDQWSDFAALYRSGSLELELGDWGPYEQDGKKHFRLLQIVGCVRIAVRWFTDVVGRYDLRGPYEASMAFRNTEGSYLGHFATGWRDERRIQRFARPCREANLLLRREILEWPKADQVSELAFAMGAMIEDSWGSSDRRFLTLNAEGAGSFDEGQFYQL